MTNEPGGSGADASAGAIETVVTEKVIMTWPGRRVPGLLTLKNGRLEWRRSRWAFPLNFLIEPIESLVMTKGPSRMSMNANEVAVASAGYWNPWWSGPGFTLGGFLDEPRPCIAVYVIESSQTFEFAVRDADRWLSDLLQAGAKQGVFSK